MKKSLFSVKDKHVLVSGAAKGNGKAIADAFVNEGAIVFYVDKLKIVSDNVKIDKTKRSKSFVVDLEDRIQLKSFFNKIKTIDVLVNNVGITLPNDQFDSLDNWDKTINLNLT